MASLQSKKAPQKTNQTNIDINMLTKETMKESATQQPVQFQVSFDPSDSNNSVKIQLPNGKTVTSEKVS